MAVSLRVRNNIHYAYWREGGKIREKSVGRDPRVAKRRAAEFEEDLFNRRNGIKREIKWNDFEKVFLEYCRTNMSSKTVDRNQSVFNSFKYLIPVARVSEINIQMIEEYKSIRKDSAINPSTINRELSTIKSALRKAKEWNYAVQNIDGIQKLPVPKTPPFFFSNEQLNRILEKTTPYWRIVVLLGIYAGLRRGEMLNLNWKDVDFDRHELIVLPTDAWKPKDKEFRVIPLHQKLESKLKVWRELSSSEKVLPWMYRENSFSIEFKRQKRRAGITKGSLHTLRHSFASHLSINNVSLHKIKELMGHESVSTTQIYAHLNSPSLHQAISSLPEWDKREVGDG